MGGKYKPIFILLHNQPKEEKSQSNSLIFPTTANRGASPKLSEGAEGGWGESGAPIYSPPDHNMMCDHE